jgi:hypothetical protein
MTTPATPTSPTSPTIVNAPTASGVARVGARVIPAERFPRRGAFCLVAGALAIVNSMGKRGTREVDGVQKDFIDMSEPYAEVHLVETRIDHPNYGHFKRAPEDFGLNATGEAPGGPIGDVQERGGEIFNVPFDAIERAPWAIVGPIVDARNGDAPRPDVLWAARAGYLLSAEEEAAVPALLAAEEQAKADAAYIAEHPDARAVEETIEQERQSFIARVESLRAGARERILAERPASGASTTTTRR